MSTFRRDQTRILWILWLTYGAFYFCRANISSAVPGLEHHLHLTKSQIGWVLGGFKLTYGVGQLINGQFAERLGARRLLAIGMLASAVLNVVFGFATGFYFLVFVWATNGFAQSMGWSPTMRVAANWFGAKDRGRAIAIIGTGYQLLGSVTFVVAGTAADALGWRAALYVPAGVLALAAIYMLQTLDERPADGAAAIGDAPTPRSTGTWQENLAATLSNPRLWLLALALGGLNACRYGFLDWGVAHLMEVQRSSLGSAALKNSILPAGGIAGTLLAGWATDRYFAGRRVPVMVAMLLSLTALVMGYDAIIRGNVVLSTLVLAAIGALIFGPQVLLVGTTPVDLAKRGTAAAACGFVNFVGYLGAAAGDQITGYLVQHYDWQAALWFWAGCAFGAAIVVIPLWRAAADRSQA